MVNRSTRRGFLTDVSRGTLLATLGPTVALELGLVSPAFADQSQESSLTFGDFEPLVCELQQTPLDRLQPLLVGKLNSGLSLKTLTGAAALANARTFGGEDYIGFHTFMALGPALKMSTMLSGPSAALPVLKVVYRNTGRIQECGGRDSEVLHDISPGAAESPADDAMLRAAVQSKDVARSEQLLSALATRSPVGALNALIPLVEDNPEVHRTVLPFRAWEMLDVVGSEHATTLLRQSLRYCLQSEIHRRESWNEHATMLISLLDEFHLNGRSPGTNPADDEYVRKLSRHFAECSPEDAARAAAETLAEGFAPAVIGEAVSLAASRLVLTDGGRQPEWESPGKPAGCVHGDSVGVHASDAANAWRHLAAVSSGPAAVSCVIIGAWQIARDRAASRNLLNQPLPTERHLNEFSSTDPDSLLTALKEAIRFNQQAHAVAIAQRYGQHSLPADRLFSTLLKYAVSEDGALHAEKYFHTVHDDFRMTRPALRWQHVAALARVTASEYGRPAPGHAEARDLLKITG
ncbi:MAG: hypothetical protein R3C49_21165 [Planctomycetaceae bacterium]